jgi:uncharacterized protein
MVKHDRSMRIRPITAHLRIAIDKVNGCNSSPQEVIYHPPARIGTTMHHRNHPEITKRLRRADGHLHKIIKMIEEGRPCPEVAQQLQAVESAIENAKKALIHDHITHCVNRSLKAAGPAGRSALREFKLVARYL